MSQTQTQSWIALARDAEGVHCYRLTYNSTSTPQAKAHFLQIAKQEGWEPFAEIEMFLVPQEPQRETLSKIAFFPAK